MWHEAIFSINKNQGIILPNTLIFFITLSSLSSFTLSHRQPPPTTIVLVTATDSLITILISQTLFVLPIFSMSFSSLSLLRSPSLLPQNFPFSLTLFLRSERRIYELCPPHINIWMCLKDDDSVK